MSDSYSTGYPSAASPLEKADLQISSTWRTYLKRSAKVSSHQKHHNLEPIMLEGFWDNFGAIFGYFLVSRGPLGASWAVLGGFLGAVLDFWSFLEASWGRSWEPCCAKVGLLNFPKLHFSIFWPFRKAWNFQRIFEIDLGFSWARLETVLGSSLEEFES